MALTPTHKQYGAPRHWRFAGRDWPVSGLTPYQLGLLDGYLEDNVPSPLARVKGLLRQDDVFSKEERMALIERARGEMEPEYAPDGTQVGGWPPTFNSREGQRLLFYGKGVGFLLFVILSKHTPGFTRAEGEELSKRMTAEDLAALTDLLQVGAPEGGEGAPTDDEDDEDPDLPRGYVDPKK